MGGISYPRTVGGTEQARLVSQIEDKVEALLNSVDPSASDLASIMALVDRVSFEKLPKALQVKLLGLLRGKLQARVATTQFDLSNANNTVARAAVQAMNNAMIRLALSFDGTDKRLPLHESLNQTGVFDFKPLSDIEDLTLYSTSDGMVLIENQDAESPEFGSAEKNSSLCNKAINRAKSEIQKRLVEGWEANTIVSINASFGVKRVKRQFDLLKHQGHGPQRHEGDITHMQLEDRCTKGIDPMSGTTTDAVTGGKHRYSRNATKVNTPQDYVKAESHLKNSEEFTRKIQISESIGQRLVVIKESKLKEIYGSDYSSKVAGKTRKGSAKNPQSVINTVFTDESKMIGVYKKSDNVGWELLTMYPDI